MKRQSIKKDKHLICDQKTHKDVEQLKKDIHKGWVYFFSKRGYTKNIKFTTDIQLKDE